MDGGWPPAMADGRRPDTIFSLGYLEPHQNQMYLRNASQNPPPNVINTYESGNNGTEIIPLHTQLAEYVYGKEALGAVGLIR